MDAPPDQSNETQVGVQSLGTLPGADLEYDRERSEYQASSL